VNPFEPWHTEPWRWFLFEIVLTPGEWIAAWIGAIAFYAWLVWLA